MQTSSQGQSRAPLPMNWADVRQLWSRGCAAVSLLHHCRYWYRQPPYAAPGRSRGLPAPAPIGNSLVLLAEVPGAQLWLCWTKAGASAAGWSANQARRFIFFFPSSYQTSLEDLTMNQSYTFAEIHRTFMQFSRSVQIFLKDKKAQNRSWFLTA